MGYIIRTNGRYIACNGKTTASALKARVFSENGVKAEFERFAKGNLNLRADFVIKPAMFSGV